MKAKKKVSYTSLQESLRHMNREAESYLSAKRRAVDEADDLRKRLAQAEADRDWLRWMMNVVGRALDAAQSEARRLTNR